MAAEGVPPEEFESLTPHEVIETWIRDRELALAQNALHARLGSNEGDAEAWFLCGACAMVQRRFDAAQKDFAKAAGLEPEQVRYVSAQAAACLAALKPEEALALAHMAHEMSPEDPVTLINLLQALIKLKRYDEALPYAEQLARIDAELSVARQLMGEVLRGLNRFTAALSWFEAALALDPDDVRAQVDIAVCVSHLGDPRAALRMTQNLLETVEHDAQVYSSLGIRAQDAGSPHLAFQFFKKGYSVFPDDQTLCMNLGITVQGMGNPGEALFYFKRALTLNESTAMAWYMAGECYLALRQRDDALHCLERCVALEPSHSQALAHLAGLFKELGKTDQAKTLLRQAIEHDPKWLQPYLNLYGFLKDEGDFEEAAVVLLQAEALGEKAQALKQAQADLRLKRGDIAGANAMFREILEDQPQNPDAMSGLLFCSNYDPELGPERIAAAYKSWDERFVRWRAPGPDFRFANRPTARRRIKLGYVSGDLRGHSVAFFAEPLLAHHDHQRFEVYCYANQKGGDATTGRFMRYADHWRWTHDLSDDALVEMIRLDGIDILIDLSNHTAYHRLYMFGRKPAPVQMTTIGMPTTTGLSAIDYRITDAWMDPPGLTEHLHAEKLLRILSGWCYRPSDEAADLPVMPAPALKNGHLSLASFNAFGKINRRVWTLWGRLLQAVPTAQLYVATGGKDDDEALNEQVRSACADCGVPLEQLKLIGRMPLKAYFEFHQNVDIVLDSFPYTGATVTAHALWMGVPVLTLAGPSPIHRSATSMLSSVGLSAFVADTEDDYVAIAKRWSQDLSGLADIRRRLREDMQKSPLMDGARVTQDLEKKLRAVWTDWCKAHKPHNTHTQRTTHD